MFHFFLFVSHFMLIISMTGETRASHEKNSRPDRCRWAMDVTLEAIHDNVEAWQYALPPAPALEGIGNYQSSRAFVPY